MQSSSFLGQINNNSKNGGVGSQSEIMALPTSFHPANKLSTITDGQNSSNTNTVIVTSSPAKRVI